MSKTNELFQKMRERGSLNSEQIDRMEISYQEEMELAKWKYSEEGKKNREEIRYTLNKVFEEFHPMQFIAPELAKRRIDE